MSTITERAVFPKGVPIGMTREQAIELFDELRAAGLIGYSIGPNRSGEYGPHVEIWKGDHFLDLKQRASLGDGARYVFNRIVSGEFQEIVDQIEPEGARIRRV